MSDDRIPHTALVLGFGGLVPFIACAICLVVDTQLPLLGDPARAMLAYGAVILSFLGGVRWGHALRMTDGGLQQQAFVLSVGPSIAAWLLLLPPTLMGLIVLPVLFVLLAVADEQLTKVGVPIWYAKLRRILTSVAVLSLMASISGLTV
jgi:Protein of unknown function (DUF3429)